MGRNIKVIFCVFTAFLMYSVSTGSVLGKESIFSKFDMNDDYIAPLIVGGDLAVEGEFRGKISIQYTNGTHICGGTLIHESHILTSAFCVTTEWGAVINPNTYRLMGDDLSLSVFSGNPNRQLRGATHVFVHPEYNIATLDHNVAIIRTDSPYTVSETFNPVLRPGDSSPVDTQCSVAGWGHLFFNGPISFQLRRVNVVVISRTVCNANTSYNGSIRGGMFCAGNMLGGEDACTRDGGGGLICNDLVYGIVSWGRECGLAGFPGVYTDVAIYNFWIDSIIGWEGEHENITTPTTMMTPTTPNPPGGAGVVYNSIFLLISSITFVLLK